MAVRTILHMFDPIHHASPFDINMAVDAGFDVVIPYSGVKLEEVNGLVQDAIFSRSPSGVERTGIFVGGRDMELAMRMLDETRNAMVPLLSFPCWRIQVAHLRRRRRWLPLLKSNLKRSMIVYWRGAEPWCSEGPDRLV